MKHLVKISNVADLSRTAGIIGAAGRVGYRLGKGGFTFDGLESAKNISYRRVAAYFNNTNNQDCIIQIDAADSKLSDIQEVLQAALPGARNIEICTEESRLSLII